MKTERRRELHTNELSQQIEQLSDYVRQNANRLLAVGSVVIVLVVAVAWYVRSAQAKLMDGWATLSDATLAADPDTAINRYRSVAGETANADLIIAAWLRIGETAMNRLITPATAKEATDSSAAARENWRATAQEAFEKVVQLAGARQANARGQALMMLGVLAEDRGQFEKAREYYQKIIEQKEFAATPLPMQAEYRIAGLARWSEPVTFPPAAITVPSPEAAPAAISAPPDGQQLIMSRTIDLKAGEVVEGDTSIPVRITEQSAPVPTTQPADDGDGN